MAFCLSTGLIRPGTGEANIASPVEDSGGGPRKQARRNRERGCKRRAEHLNSSAIEAAKYRRGALCRYIGHGAA